MMRGDLRWYAVGLVVVLILLLAGGQDAADADLERASYVRPDCPAEDTCAIDYRHGTWRIMECEGACDDRGARSTWRRLYVRDTDPLEG